MNRQAEREYRDGLDGLRFSAEARARMVENLTAGRETEPAGRRSFRPLRAAVIAACLCLALVGTAFAAVQAFGRIGIINEVHEPLRAGYSVGGSVRQFPLEQFSRALQKDAAAGSYLVCMKDWQSVKDYLNLPLMDSRLLMEESEHIPIFTSGDPFGVYLTGLEDGALKSLEDGGAPQVVRVATASLVDNWDISVTIFAATEYADLEHGLPGLHIEYAEDYNGCTSHSFTSEDYAMACGGTAAVICDRAGGHYSAFFTYHGLLYELQALGVLDAEADCPSGKEILLKVLDSFTV